MTDRELFIQAWEALTWNLPVIEDHGNKKQLNIQHKAITALRDRLEQPKQEKDWDAVAEQQLASLKRATRKTLEDAVVRAVNNMADEPKPKRKPLDKMTVLDLADQHLYEGGKIYGILEFARAIEYKHGIKGEE